MPVAAQNMSLLNRRPVSTVCLVACLTLGGCETAKNAWDNLPDASATSSDDAKVVGSHEELLAELKLLRAELNKRSSRFKSELAEARAELARRQAAGEISPERAAQSPQQILNAQLSELERLKAELARRQEAKDLKQEAIATSLAENQVAFSSIDQCLSAASDFRAAFRGRSDLLLLVDEKENKVYRNGDRSLLLLTSKESCDVSFAGGSLNDYTLGLVHILEEQGGVVEKNEIAGLSVISVAHPRGNFRLASGKKVIGNGGNTNLYTTISVVEG